MSTLTRFPIRDIVLPDGPRLVVERHLAMLAKFEGFVDRINYANELVEALGHLAFAGAIDGKQQAAALRRIRAVLQDDLGAVTSNDFNVFQVQAADDAEVRS